MEWKNEYENCSLEDHISLVRKGNKRKLQPKLWFFQATFPVNLELHLVQHTKKEQTDGTD
jgi:hypothetical protein